MAGEAKSMEIGKVGGSRRYRTAMLAVSPYFLSFRILRFLRIFVDYFCYLFAKIISHRSRPPTPSAYPHLLKEQRGNPKIRSVSFLEEYLFIFFLKTKIII